MHYFKQSDERWDQMQIIRSFIECFGVLSNLKQIFNSLKKEYENMKVLNSFIEIFDIFNGTKAVQKFDEFSMRAPKSRGSVFKFLSKRISSLYMGGKDTYSVGYLGMGKNIDKLENMPFIGSFIAMSAGSSHCAAINGNGNVFIWGSGKEYKLGFGDENSRYIPTYLSLFGQKAIILALSSYHTLILTEQGRVYSFGSGYGGALGHGNDESAKMPKLIKAIVHVQIKHISAGYSQSMLVSEDGKVYAFGTNGNGQCGLGEAIKEILIPTMINLPSSMIIVSAECGYSHSILLSSNGQTLSCGDGDCNGHGKTLYEPNALKTLQSENITSIATGDNHTLCLNEKNKIWSFGQMTEPKQVKYFVDNKIDIGSIYANIDQSAAVTLDGKDLYVWGKKFDDVPNKKDLSEDEKIVSVAFGLKFMGIIFEQNEECKESEYVLKDGENMFVKDVNNKRCHQIYVQNELLFGDNEWLQIQTERPNYSLFPYFGHKFVDNLVMNDEKTMIELIKYSEIDSVHYSDILSAEYFLYLGIWNESIIEKKNEFMQKAQKYSFDKMDKIKFKMEQNTKNVCIYVKPKGVDTMYLLKNLKKGFL